MNKFKSGIKIKIIMGCMLAMSTVMYFIDDSPYVKIACFILCILSILCIIDAFTQEYVVEEERLVYKSIYRTIIVYWKDVRVISLSSFAYYQREKKPCIWVQKTEDVMNCRMGKTMSLSYFIKDYKVLVRMIVEKCKDNKRAYVEESVLKLISESSDK